MSIFELFAPVQFPGRTCGRYCSSTRIIDDEHDVHRWQRAALRARASEVAVSVTAGAYAKETPEG